MLRLWNRLVALPESRLTNYIFHWDLSYKNRPGSWSDAICKLFSDNELDFYFENVQICELGSVYVILKANECESLNDRRYTKPKQDTIICTRVILNKSVIWIWIFQNIIVHYLLNLGLVSCLLRLKLDATEVFHYLSAYVQCVSRNLWKTYTIFFVFAEAIMNSGLRCTTKPQPLLTNFTIFRSWINLSISLTTYKETSLPFLLKP